MPSGPSSINLANAFGALARCFPEADCLASPRRRLRWSDVRERAGRFAGFLAANGCGLAQERDELAGWECGQSVIGLMLYNGHEYLETMLGSYAARCAPANFTWRATVAELTHLLSDSRAEVLVYERALAATVAGALAGLPRRPLLVEVDSLSDATEAPLLDAAVAYESLLTASDEVWLSGSPDDLYILYTGGTTGSPKGTLWRQADFVAGALGVRATTVEELEASARRSVGKLRCLPAPPLIHGAAQWNAWSTWLAGGVVVIQSAVDHFDAADVLDTVERERATSLQIVGDAFGRPLLRELAARPRDLSSLRFVTSGGTVLSPEVRDGLRAAIPGVTVLDIMGSSESGRLAVATYGDDRSSDFQPSGATVVLDETRHALLDRSDASVGWLATTGPIPLGYLGDRAKTEATFPTIDGVRYTVPGDRAGWRVDGTIEVLGRDAAVINTGGEKVFAEEVENALRSHPAVEDALVIGRPHPTLGNEVCAVVAPRPGADAPAPDELRNHAGSVLARYKLPRHIVVRPMIRRSPAGKADYRWAKDQVIDG